jgi:hypothetical protein
LFWICWKEKYLNALEDGETYWEKYWSLYIQSTSNILALSLSLLLLPLWSIEHLWNTLFHCSFLILGQSVGVLGWGISPSQGLYLHKHRINADISMPWVRFEPMITVFDRAKQFMPQTTWPLRSPVILFEYICNEIFLSLFLQIHIFVETEWRDRHMFMNSWEQTCYFLCRIWGPRSNGCE